MTSALTCKAALPKTQYRHSCAALETLLVALMLSLLCLMLALSVCRLTLVKGWNMDELANYARLVELGEPDFIEVKGVTYCGSSGASSLTMQNVPYHEDVCAFGEVIPWSSEK